jgi:excisionase family DNA binding protein
MKTEEILNKLHSIEKLILKQHYKPLNLVEAADYLSVSQSHLYKLTRRRKIPCHKPNGKYLYFFRGELDEWIKAGQKVKGKRKKEGSHETPQRNAGQVINTKALKGVKESTDGIKIKEHSTGQGLAITLDTEKHDER